MKRVNGDKDVKRLECTNPVKGLWRYRFDVQGNEDGSATYMEEEFDHKPSMDELKNIVISYINAKTDEKILSGFVWQGMEVWLSRENQFNYKAAYDMALQTGGKNLPVLFKLGTDEDVKLFRFYDLNNLTDFYTGCLKWVQDAIESGWSEKNKALLDIAALKELKVPELKVE